MCLSQLLSSYLHIIFFLPTFVSPAGSLHNSVKPLAASNLKDYKVNIN